MIGGMVEAEAGATIFDPCAGEGEAVSLIAATAGIPQDKIFAVELEHGRSQALARNLPKATVYKTTDYLGALRSGNASIVYCNPPFDATIGGGRHEAAFFDRAINQTMVGGLFILVAPESVIVGDRCRLITSYLGGVQAFRPPTIDRKFGELVVMGYRLPERISGQWSIAKFIRDFREFTQYTVRECFSKPSVLKTAYTPEELEVELRKSPLMPMLSARELTQRRRVRPPMDLRAGHMAMLLASGLMDGLVDTGNRKTTHIVRGSVKKVVDSTETRDGDKIKVRETERIVLTVRTVDNFGNIKTLTEKLKETEAEVEVETEVVGEEVDA